MDHGSNFRDGYDFRRFDARVEQQAEHWRGMAVDRGGWSPYAAHGTPTSSLKEAGWVTDGRNIAFVKRRARLEHKAVDIQGLGIEKIAADMGFDLGVPVAPGCLWQPPGREKQKPWYLSAAPFSFNARNTYPQYVARAAGSLRYPDPADKTLARAKIERQILTDAATANTALWVFHVFIGDQHEHMRPNNFQASVTARRQAGVRIAAHDHAYAEMAFVRPHVVNHSDAALWPFGGNCAAYTGRMTAGRLEGIAGNWRPPVDIGAADAMLARLEAYPRERIAEIVYRVPRDVLPGARKEKMVKDLMISKHKTIGWFNRRLAEFAGSCAEPPRPSVLYHIPHGP
jgi:hypothetical protein